MLKIVKPIINIVTARQIFLYQIYYILQHLYPYTHLTINNLNYLLLIYNNNISDQVIGIYFIIFLITFLLKIDRLHTLYNVQSI